MKTILTNAHARVSETLSARRVHLDALARLLLEREFVDRAEFDQLLGGGGEASPPAGHD